MDKKENKIKKKDPLLDFIFDLDLDLDLDDLDLDSIKLNNNQKNNNQKDNKEIKIDSKKGEKIIREKENLKTFKENQTKDNKNNLENNLENDLENNLENNLEKFNKKINESQKFKNSIKPKNNLPKEDIESLINNIALFLKESDPKNIKDIKDYFLKNSEKINFKRLSEFNTGDEIFRNNIVFLANGFGYYYNPHKDLIIDFFFPYDLIYFPIILEYQKIKINILFREKSTIFICPKSDIIFKKIFYKYIIKKYNQNIIRELNLRKLDSYNKLLFFIYFYLENYYKLDLRIENYNNDKNFNNEIYQIKLPIKKIANFLGISYEVIVRNIKKMKDSNIISEKENKLFINLKELKNTFNYLEKKLII